MLMEIKNFRALLTCYCPIVAKLRPLLNKGCNNTCSCSTFNFYLKPNENCELTLNVIEVLNNKRKMLLYVWM